MACLKFRFYESQFRLGLCPGPPLGGANDAPPDPLVRWEGGYPGGGYLLPITHPSTLSACRSWRLWHQAYLDPPAVNSWRRAWVQSLSSYKFLLEYQITIFCNLQYGYGLRIRLGFVLGIGSVIRLALLFYFLSHWQPTIASPPQ